VRVRIYPAADGEPEETSPQFAPAQATPGVLGGARTLWQAFFKGRIER
jgi:sulfite dehydrogenase (quinone) subunit SoeA